MEFENLLQITQGLLVASTALLGLSGLFVAQLRLGAWEESGQRIGQKDYNLLRNLILISLISGTVAILLNLINLWGISNCLVIYIIATSLVALQVIAFFGMIVYIFLPSYEKLNKNN